MAVVGPKKLTESGVMAMFIEALNEPSADWWARICPRINSSDLEGETHYWMKGVRQMRESKGDLNKGGLIGEGYFVASTPYDAALGIPRGVWDHDQTAQVERMVNAQAAIARRHPGLLLQSAIEAADAKACYDGQYFYDTDHPTVTDAGVATTQSNEVPQTVTSATAPTTDEMETAVLTAIARLLSLKDPDGNECNSGASRFLMTVPTGLWPAAQKVTKARLLAAGGTNIVADSDLFAIRVAHCPRLSSASNCQIHIEDDGATPFFHQVVDDVDPEVLGRGSEHDRLHQELLFIVRARYGIGLGEYQRSVQIQFSGA